MMRYVWLLVIVWTLIIAGLMVWNLFQTRQAAQQIAIVQARANFDKDQAIRLWASSHGGVYVPIDEHTPSNPYLSHIPERDIETPSGGELTLMNPAYMIRQMNEDFAELYGIVGHITSLDVLRPANAPDDWERAALESFEQGETEALEFTHINDEPYLRLMQPMITTEGCLKCHAHQGYQVGDVRGGVGIALPMSILAAEERQTATTQAISLGLLWVLGLGGIGLTGWSFNQRVRERDFTTTALQESEGRLRIVVEELSEHREHLEEMVDGRTSELKQEITERRQAEEALQEYQHRLEAQNTELRKLTQAVEQSANVVVITNLEGCIEYVNPKFVETTGYTVEEALGQNPRILKSGAQNDAYYKELWQTIASGREWRGEFHNKRKDGTLYWEQASIAPIYDAMGQMMNLIAIKEDISERKRAEEALKRRNRELTLLNQVGQELTAMLELQQVAEQSLRATIETVGAEAVSIWLWDEAQEGWLICPAFATSTTTSHAQNHTMVNLRLQPGQGVAGWVAQTGESVIVSNVSDDARFFPGIDEQIGFRTRSLLTVPLQVRDAIIGVLEVVNKQHGAFDTDDLILVETLAASAAIAIDNARLVETLRQYTLQLEAHNEELDAFAHTVAHDLKNPLSPIVGYAEVMAMDYASIIGPDGVGYLRKIVQSGHKMSNIINELLLLAGARKMDVDVEALDMASIVRQAQERLGFMFEEHQAEIILPETWPTALGYGPWVEEVWVNYLSNALKYGGQPPHVELGADIGQIVNSPHDVVRFWVRDNGLGLSPEEQVRLFTPFTRLDQVRAKGHGLGLSIVRRIVEKLGGQVGVESEIGTGSLFWFTLESVSQKT